MDGKEPLDDFTEKLRLEKDSDLAEENNLMVDEI